jgi:hypothetical protein
MYRPHRTKASPAACWANAAAPACQAVGQVPQPTTSTSRTKEPIAMSAQSTSQPCRRASAPSHPQAFTPPKAYTPCRHALHTAQPCTRRHTTPAHGLCGTTQQQIATCIASSASRTRSRPARGRHLQQTPRVGCHWHMAHSRACARACAPSFSHHALPRKQGDTDAQPQSCLAATPSPSPHLHTCRRIWARKNTVPHRRYYI